MITIYIYFTIAIIMFFLMLIPLLRQLIFVEKQHTGVGVAFTLFLLFASIFWPILLMAEIKDWFQHENNTR